MFNSHTIIRIKIKSSNNIIQLFIFPWNIITAFRAPLGSNFKNGSIAKVEHSPLTRGGPEHELVMVDHDIKMEALKSTHYLKSLITAEMSMDLEHKGQQRCQGEMYVRFLAFTSGDLRSLYDHSEGFFRRQLILSVKRRPPD